jgi:hypothetical protein
MHGNANVYVNIHCCMCLHHVSCLIYWHKKLKIHPRTLIFLQIGIKASIPALGMTHKMEKLILIDVKPEGTLEAKEIS